MASIAIPEQPISWNDKVLYLLNAIVSAGGPTASVDIDMFGSVPVSLGQKVMASSMPVVIASDQTAIPVTSGLPVGAATSALQTIGNSSLASLDADIDVPLSTRATESTLSTLNGKFSALGQGTMATSTPVVLPSDQSAIPVTAPTLTKGTQGTNGFSVQDLKDAGRNLTTFFMPLPIISTAADTLQTLSGYKSGAAVAGTTTPAVVTAGKKYRVTKITLTYSSAGTVGSALFTLRANTGGLVAIGSPVIFQQSLGVASSTNGHAASISIPFPDGLEFDAGTGIGVSVVGLSNAMVAAARGYAQVSIVGYEY